MLELIEALQIFMRHGDVGYPTHCEHDVLYIFPKDPEGFTQEEKTRLDELGFNYGSPDGTTTGWYSYKYGSC